MWRLVMRNYLVWKKLLASSVAVHLADPVIFMLGFGFGLGALIGDVEGLSYLQFVAAGMVAYGTMNSASFEALYSAFTRMHVQRTWESILNAPMIWMISYSANGCGRQLKDSWPVSPCWLC